MALIVWEDIMQCKDLDEVLEELEGHGDEKDSLVKNMKIRILKSKIFPG